MLNVHLSVPSGCLATTTFAGAVSATEAASADGFSKRFNLSAISLPLFPMSGSVLVGIDCSFKRRTEGVKTVEIFLRLVVEIVSIVQALTRVAVVETNELLAKFDRVGACRRGLQLRIDFALRVDLRLRVGLALEVDVRLVADEAFAFGVRLRPVSLNLTRSRLVGVLLCFFSGGRRGIRLGRCRIGRRLRLTLSRNRRGLGRLCA